MKGHWHTLDGLRGVLSLLVVLLHFGINSFLQRRFGLPPLPLSLAVDVFFLLSGFVLTHSARRGISFPVFLRKRLWRLLPIYYLTTLAAMPFLPALPGHQWAELFVAGPLLGRDPINFPAWSICYELYLPLLAVLMPIRLPQRMIAPALAASLLAMAACCYLVATQEAQLYGLRALCGLAAGHLLYRQGAQIALGFDIAAVAVILAILMAALMPALAMLVPFLAAAAICAGTQNGGRLFVLPPCRWLGDISYTLYLIHIPVLLALPWLVGHSVNQNPAMKGLGIILSLILATVLTLLVERPAMAFAAQRQVAPAPARG